MAESVASDIVGPLSIAKRFYLQETDSPRNQKDYKAANGSVIRSPGEKVISGLPRKARTSP
eukprot:11169852-Lingulodinium_polyedra.AAC.1